MRESTLSEIVSNVALRSSRLLSFVPIVFLDVFVISSFFKRSRIYPNFSAAKITWLGHLKCCPGFVFFSSWEARVAQVVRALASHTISAQFQILVLTLPHDGWVCCWFSPLLREVFPVYYAVFRLAWQHFQIPIQSGGMHRHALIKNP